ncbi:MAG: phosphatase PAP2 family protein [Paracoccus sp. (in: a-proteobacteria)]|uniref:phosphatase PAP2 family protein n=1 Tax=Paracoccus sp. TaxID=267 RepID=UPI00405A2DBC
MAAALIRTREAIAGTEQIQPVAGQASGLDITARLERLDDIDREAVMAGELLEDISFSATGYDPAENTARTITVLRRKTGTNPLKASYTELAAITRPGLDDFRQAATLIGSYAELRSDRAAEIQVQTQHLVPFFAAILPIEASRAPATLEMLDLAQDMATFVVMRVKLNLGCPRPPQFSDRIQPMIACPSHASLPSGHATQAFTLATILALLQDPDAGVASDSQLYRLACRISINRTVAGVHFPADSAAGAVLGIQLGRYLAARARKSAFGSAGEVGRGDFDGTLFQNSGQPRDFHYAILNQMVAGADPSTSFSTDAARVRPAPLWGSLCKRAVAEWGQRWS